jgi:hypothetical protein
MYFFQSFAEPPRSLGTDNSTANFSSRSQPIEKNKRIPITITKQYKRQRMVGPSNHENKLCSQSYSRTWQHQFQMIQSQQQHQAMRLVGLRNCGLEYRSIGRLYDLQQHVVAGNFWGVTANNLRRKEQQTAHRLQKTRFSSTALCIAAPSTKLVGLSPLIIYLQPCLQIVDCETYVGQCDGGRWGRNLLETDE